jgi:hypothetical protein
MIVAFAPSSPVRFTDIPETGPIAAMISGEPILLGRSSEP